MIIKKIEEENKLKKKEQYNQAKRGSFIDAFLEKMHYKPSKKHNLSDKSSGWDMKHMSSLQLQSEINECFIRKMGPNVIQSGSNTLTKK